MSCTIVHRVHDTTFVVHDDIWVVPNVVLHRAPGARDYICGARCRAPLCTGCTMLYGWCLMLYVCCTMSCAIVHRVHDTTFFSTMLHGWCTMLCTIVHPVHDALWVVHNAVHYRALGA